MRKTICLAKDCWRQSFLALFIILMSVFSCMPSRVTASDIFGDTIRISLNDYDAIFLNKNFRLLAAKYSIDAAKAATIQAKLWDNPNFSVEHNLYDGGKNGFFGFNHSGYTDFQVQQLLVLGGKREKLVNLNEIKVRNSELEFIALIRNLKYEYHKNFYDLVYLEKALKFYENSTESLRQTLQASEANFQKGWAVLSDVLRLKSLIITLETEKQSIINQIEDAQNKLKIFICDSMSSTKYYFPEYSNSSLSGVSLAGINIEKLADSVSQGRYDYVIANNNVLYSAADIDYQKSLAVPNVSVGVKVSRMGETRSANIAANCSIDLPIFNKNDGNIMASQANYEADKMTLNQVKISIVNDIITAYKKALNYEKYYHSIDKAFSEQSNKNVQNMLDNYRKKNITIIELADFIESYRTTLLQLNDIERNYINAIELLNYELNFELIK